MNTIPSLRTVAAMLFLVSLVSAQGLSFRKLEILASFSRPTKIVNREKDSHIKDIESLDARHGFAFTGDTLFRTDDGGATWREVDLGLSGSETISTIFFSEFSEGLAVVKDNAVPGISLAKTTDGGSSWQRSPIALRPDDLAEADLDSARIDNVQLDSGRGFLALSLDLASSSNFYRMSMYSSEDGGRTWSFSYGLSELRRSGKAIERQSGDWVLTTEGSCAGFKIGCVQETKIFANGTEITPPQIKELARQEKEEAEVEVARSAETLGGSTRFSLNRGFDKCDTASVSQMRSWWDNSPFYDVNVYMSGRNRACSAQPNLSASWVDQVTAMGWGLIPTVVGYQSPCTASTTTAKLSYDPPTAETQGRGEADIAVAAAVNLGLAAGSILYYDMERYDETAATTGCRTATTAFLKGWTDRLKELGYKSGTYGSPKNAQEDWATLPPASRMDAIWMARWDNKATVWAYDTFPNFPTDVWNDHQRIKQWQGPHNETWGGVTFNIDGDISDAPVAGPVIAKNKVADFDGDGKTDISVFRPDTGEWFIAGSLGPTYEVYQFGTATDILTPGDYDGDGKTDLAIFRPGEGTWYFRTKGGQFSSKAFGAAGDIPVPADYNGDGKTDVAVFRPSNATWYIAGSDSLGSFTVIQFGADGDKPVRGDYDGDGKDDLAVWRPSNGFWYVLASSGRYFGGQWGIATDKPVQGDYDGDGKTDFAIVRGHTLFINSSKEGFRIADFGADTDIPVPGDYDGDGRFDLGVFRPSNGTWYTLQSSGAYRVYGFGTQNDKPIPATYLPQ